MGKKSLVGQYFIVCSSYACSHHLECCIPIIFPPSQIIHVSETEKSLKHYKFCVLCHIGPLPFYEYFHCWPKHSVTEVSLLPRNEVTHSLSSEWLEGAGLERKDQLHSKKNYEIKDSSELSACVHGMCMKAFLNTPCWSILWHILLVLHNPGIWVRLVWGSHSQLVHVHSKTSVFLVQCCSKCWE